MRQSRVLKNQVARVPTFPSGNVVGTIVHVPLGGGGWVGGGEETEHPERVTVVLDAASATVARQVLERNDEDSSRKVPAPSAVPEAVDSGEVTVTAPPGTAPRPSTRRVDPFSSALSTETAAQDGGATSTTRRTAHTTGRILRIVTLTSRCSARC